MDDKLYAIGGSTYEDSGLHVPHVPSAVNEQYPPIGYGTLPEQEPFPTTLVAAFIASVAIIGAGLLIYFKKRYRKQVNSIPDGYVYMTK